MNKYCFVLMPFGKKSEGNISIDFDQVYQLIIKPAIQKAGLEPIRADEEKVGGIIHKPMFERLLLCEYAIADLTFSNANVFYELGVRHSHKKHTTIILFAKSTRLPFDVSLLRGLPYSIGSQGELLDTEGDQQKLLEIIRESRDHQSTDSPLYQLLQNYPDIGHTKADVFRKHVEYSANLKDQLADLRNTHKNDHGQLLKSLLGFQSTLADFEEIESGVLVDLMLSYRSCGTAMGYESMLQLIAAMPKPLQQTVMVIEQKALALNRLDKGVEAEKLMLKLIDEKGPSSESYGILGRVYKDRWRNAVNAGDEPRASGALKRAVQAYHKGFQSDIRDAYPGVNTVTLMFIANPEDPELPELLPVVKYAVKRKLEQKKPDYWDYATLLELAVVEQDLDKADEYLQLMVSFADNEKFMYDTTVANLNNLLESGAFTDVDLLKKLNELIAYLQNSPV